MKSNATFESVRLFNVKQLGNGCRFGIKVSSKKQDGTYTKGTFINCKHNQMLSEGVNYTLNGFFGDNEYNDKNTLEFIVMSATEDGVRTPQPKQAPKVEVVYGKQENKLLTNEFEVNEDEIPF